MCRGNNFSHWPERKLGRFSAHPSFSSPRFAAEMRKSSTKRVSHLDRYEKLLNERDVERNQGTLISRQEILLPLSKRRQVFRD